MFTVTATERPAEQLAELVLAAIHRAEEPVTASRLRKDPAVKQEIKPRELEQFLERLVDEGQLVRFPPQQGKAPRYFDQDAEGFARQFILRLLEQEKRTPNDLRKRLGGKLRDFPRDRVPQMLEELKSAGRIHELPRLPGGRSTYYSTLPPEPREYLKTAAGRYRKQIDKVARELGEYGVSADQTETAARELAFPQTASIETQAPELQAPTARPAESAATSSAKPMQPAATAPAASGTPPARETAAWQPAADQPAAKQDLSQAILDAFEELLRERHSSSGMVPIHEVRALLHERLGPEQAEHKTFDPCVKALRREGRLRVISISDLRSATREQLDDSIPGVHETLFYLRPAS